MNIIQCSRSSDHWFDGDINKCCPLCGGLPLGMEDPETEAYDYSDPQTMSYPYPGTDVDAGEPDSDAEEQEGIQDEKMEINDIAADESPLELELSNTSLVDVIKQASSESGKTMGFFSLMTESHLDNSNKETTKEAKGEVTTEANRYLSEEPVVGWLVAISGPHFGKSFALVSGKNTIGRETGNKIVLEKDPGVSRSIHFLVIFDPLNRSFYVQPGEITSNGLTYLNDVFLKSTEDLKAKDVILAGRTKLLFVPLCGGDFAWEDYMTQK